MKKIASSILIQIKMKLKLLSAKHVPNHFTCIKLISTTTPQETYPQWKEKVTKPEGN